MMRSGVRYLYVTGCEFVSGGAGEASATDKHQEARKQFQDLKKDPSVKSAYLRQYEVTSRLVEEEVHNK